MSVEIGEITCSGDSTGFVATTDDGRKVRFRIPNQAIIDFLGENDNEIDCPQFIEETTEIFEELAQDYIQRGVEQEPVIIDFQTISHYFN
jgi:hypothetical protein